MFAFQPRTIKPPKKTYNHLIFYSFIPFKGTDGDDYHLHDRYDESLTSHSSIFH